MTEKKTVLHVSELARLGISGEELQDHVDQMARIIDCFSTLSELDTTGIEPLIHPLEAEGFLRDDRELPSSARSVMMANTDHAAHGFYTVKKVIE